MEKYKIDPQSKWWYVILAGLFAWYAATKADVAAGFLFFYIIVFVCHSVIRRLKQILANEKIRIVAHKLEKVKTLSELSEAICSYPKAKGSLKVYMLNMALEKLSQIGLGTMRINHIVANGRLCYMLGYGQQVPRRKRDNVFYYDFSTANKITYFVFPNNFEWLSGNAHQAIPLNNIIEMEMDITNDILAIIKRGKGKIYFYGKDIILLKAVIEALQAKRMHSW